MADFHAALISIVFILAVLTFIFATLRMYVRLVLQPAFSIDDVFIILAEVFFAPNLFT